MVKKNGYADKKVSKKEKPPVNVTTVWLIIITVLLAVISIFLGYSFLKEKLSLENKDLYLWFLFMLIASVISCIVGVITSHFSQKSAENKEADMVREITDILTEKTEAIKSVVKLRQADFVSGDQDDIVTKLIDCCLETGKIERIRILAQDSGSFSQFFKTHFEDTPFECHTLEILIHNPDIDENNPIIGEWMWLYGNKDIEALRIRRMNKTKRRSFFGMIIKFEQGHHNIGMIGFYQPQSENSGKKLEPFPKRYGILDEENSILNVIDAYFNYYFENAEVLKDECKNSTDVV